MAFPRVNPNLVVANAQPFTKKGGKKKPEDFVQLEREITPEPQVNTGRTSVKFNKNKSVDVTDVFGNKSTLTPDQYNKFLQSQGGGTSAGTATIKQEGTPITPETQRAAENQLRGEQGISSLQDVEAAIDILGREPRERDFNEDSAGFAELAGGVLTNAALGGTGLATAGAIAGATVKGAATGGLIGAGVGLVVAGLGSILKKVSDDDKQNVALAGINSKTAHQNMKNIIFALNKGANAIEAAIAFQEELQTIRTSERFLKQRIIDDPVFWDTKAKNQLAYIETFNRRLPFIRQQLSQAMAAPNPNAVPPQPEIFEEAVQ